MEPGTWNALVLLSALHSNELAQAFQYIRVEFALLGIASHFGERGTIVPSIPVGTPGGQGTVGIRHGKDACADRDVLAREPSG